jgi:aryl-alcohol dehydrogenase-like predicted oxidoreductase
MLSSESFPDLPSEAYFELNSFRLCRVITGLELPGDPDDPYPLVNEPTTMRTMDQLLEIGLSSFFLPPPADRYASSFRSLLGRSLAENAQFIHSAVIPPFGSRRFSVRSIENAIDECLLRAGADRLDLVFLDWKDPVDWHYLDALDHLHELVRKGKIRTDGIGVIDFTLAQLETARSQGISISCNCVELSLVDQRANNEVSEYCIANKISLIARNPLANGLLTSRWVGVPEPAPSAAVEKYASMLRRAGGWGIFQGCLFRLHAIADKHNASIAQVATRWVLQQGVDAVVFNVSPDQLGSDAGGEAQDCLHIGNVFLFALDDEDMDSLYQITKHRLC